MRPTLRCVLVFAAGFPVSLAPVMVSPRLWTLWLGYIGAVALIAGLDYVLGLPRRRVRVSVEVPDTLYIGERDDMTVEIRARGFGRPAKVEMVVDLDDDLEPHPSQEVTIPAGEPARVALPLIPRRRGEVTVETLWLRWTGPFGLMRRHKIDVVNRRVAVVPNVRAVRAAALRFFSNRDFMSGLKVEHYIGDGSELDSLREFVPGLDHRAIDWKASARHLKLLCREFRAERNHQVIVAIDTGQLMSEPLGGIPKVDHAINAGLLLGYFCLRTGDRIGLFGFDARVRSYSEPVGGIQAFARLQKHTAALDYQHLETNFTLGLAELATRLRRRSLVILLTDFVDTITAELMLENVHRLARRHVVVFVTLRDPSLTALEAREPRSLSDLHRSVVAGDFVRERKVVIQRLERMGVYCIDAPPEAISMNLLNRYLDIKRRELI